MTLPVQLGQRLQGVVTKLVFGGLGLLRHENIVIFVPFVLEGEHITYEITSIKSRYATGSLISVEKPSPDRIEPLCPFFGMCGGCQLQHIHPKIHASIKCQWLREAMHGCILPDFPLSAVAAKRIWKWRRKITLHAQYIDGEWRCGYFALDNTSIVSIDWCPIFFSSQERELLPHIQSLLQHFSESPKWSIDITISRLSENRLSLLLRGNLPLSRPTQQLLLQHAITLPKVRSCSLRFPGCRIDRGETQCSSKALGQTWYYSQEAFIQNHEELGERLWSDCIDIVDKKGEKQTILDLYSGVGVTAISLAKKGHIVTAVEWSRAAVAAAQKTAKSQNVSLSLIESSVEEYVQKTKGGEDWWIVNPPRQGLSKTVIDAMISKKPKNILYISCSPPTMARDLSALCTSGRQIVFEQMYDLFPQTTNLETVAILA